MDRTAHPLENRSAGSPLWRTVSSLLRRRSWRDRITELLAAADVRVDGVRPWDLRVRDERFFPALFTGGSLALGESYVAGWWEAEAIDELVCRLLAADLEHQIVSWRALPVAAAARIENALHAKRDAFDIGAHHYDIGNDLYARMLGEPICYSCGYWRQAETLEDAQRAKLALVCRKIGLQPGDRVLDIGCAWGSFAHYAATTYGAEVVGVTVSDEQLRWARALCEGLPVEIRLQDYRDVDEPFDHIVSIGMFEHVGPKHYRTYMEVAHRSLGDGGVFLLHTIGTNVSESHIDPWMHRHIFPNAVLPSIRQIGEAIEGLFVMEDWHNFGPYYARTLRSWLDRFDQAWPDLEPRFGQRFYRMWRYYLLACAGTFLSRTNQLWQIVLAKQPPARCYETVR